MKFILCLFFLLSMRTTYSQDKLFMESPSSEDSIINTSIKKIKMPWGNPGRFVRIVYNDGSKVKIKKKAVWGFENSKKKILRFYNGQTFQVIDTNAVIIYKTYSPRPIYYFSKNLDSNVELLDRKELFHALTDEELVNSFKQSAIIRKWIF